MDVLQTFMVEDFVMYAPPEEREKRRDTLRAELIRYNEDSTGSSTQDDNEYFVPDGYIEPTSDGYAGLDAPLGG